MGLYYRHDSSLRHETGAHPERPARIVAIEERQADAGWPGLELCEAPEATRAQLRRVHTPRHVEAIEGFCASGGGMIDGDTVAVAASFEAALRAAGGALEAAERLLAGEARFAFCGLRPPGHHATPDTAMGFCLFNNAAVAVAHALAEGAAERILILDWDVHHGNGTAEIFAASDRVLYASIHQSPLYPGTGRLDDVGVGPGVGYTLNLPVPAGADGGLFLALVQHLVAPVARELEPDLLVVSAGYDAHVADPLADCRLLDSDYGALAATVRDLGAELEAPILVCLEGGYDLEALAGSVLATTTALAGEAPAPDADPAPAEGARALFRTHWPAALAARS